MKQQPCATSLPPSRVCRLLLVVFALKLTVLGMLLFEPAMPGDDTFNPFGIASLLSGGDSSGASVAHAADSPGAPPALAPTLPELSGGQQPPAAIPTQQPGSSMQPGRALPPIGAPQTLALPPALSGAPATPGAAAPAGAPQPASGDIQEALSGKQEELARKEQELKVLEGELNTRLEKMKQLENRLAVMLKDAEETNDAKFRHLVDVLSNMKSKQAAAVLETLDKKIAVKVLANMRGRQAGEILTFVKPEIAAHLTEALARMQLPLR